MRFPNTEHLFLAGMVAAAFGVYMVVATSHRDWARVARDAHYEIALDRASITPVQVTSRGRWLEAFEVTYRTDHAIPRLHNGKTFDREIVRALVQCSSMSFKVLSVDMSVGAGRTVARQRATENDLWRQDWRPVELGTTEEVAATAACHFGRQAANQVAEVRK